MIILCSSQPNKFAFLQFNSLTEFIESYDDLDCVIKIFKDEEGYTIDNLIQNSNLLNGQDVVIMSKKYIEYLGRPAHQALFDFVWLRDSIPILQMLGPSQVEKIYCMKSCGMTLEEYLKTNAEQFDKESKEMLNVLTKEVDYSKDIKERFSEIIDKDFNLLFNSDRRIVERLHHSIGEDILLGINSKLDKIDNVKQFRNALESSINCLV